MKESRKEFIIEAHKAACEEWKLRFEKEFPKLFKERGLEAGKWYKAEIDNLFCFNGNYDIYGYALGYGIGFTGKWYNENGIGWETTGIEKATENEVFDALAKQAVKRGYKEGVTCVFGDFKDVRTIDSNVFFFDMDRNILALGNDIIFNKGKWSEIIETTITKKEAEEKLGCKIID